MTGLSEIDNLADQAAWPFCRTSMADAIFDAIGRCIDSRHVKLGCIVGHPGVGKSQVLQAFTLRTPGTMMVTMDCCHSTLGQALGCIVSAFGVARCRAASDTYEDLLALVKSRGLRCLLVDEAQQSMTPLSNALRQLSDATGLAVVFSGNPRYLSNFGKEKEAFAQITSRLAVNLRLGAVPITDVMLILDTIGVTDRAARQLLFKSSQSHGALRIVRTLYEEALKLAGRPGSITTGHVHEASALIGVRS